MSNLTPEEEAAEAAARARVAEAFANEPPMDPERAKRRLELSLEARRRIVEADGNIL